MIFYFTGTGNSLYVAEKLSEGIDENILDIGQLVKENRYEFDLSDNKYLGFVFPVYYYSAPFIVEEFIKKLKLVNSECMKVFLFLTCGATTGASHEQVAKLLKEKGINTDFRFAVAMPDNYILLYNLDHEEKQVKSIELSNKKIIDAIDILKSDRVGDYISIKGPLPGIVSLFAHRAYDLTRNTKKFYAEDFCIDCKLCEEICPESAIKMKDGKPTWVKEKCSHCLGCISRCPVEAIQYSKRTIGRRRYTNPYVKL